MLGNILPPYHSLQELNLDWILTKVKDMLRFLPDDGSVGQILRRTAHGAEWSNEQGGGGAVNSVNGQTGDVVLTAADVGALPDTTVIPTDTSDLTNTAGFVDAAGAAAAAPVQSVNGQTGAVSLTIPTDTSDLTNTAGFVDAAGAAAAAPVQSVNGQTGAVVIPTGSASWGTPSLETFPFTPTSDGFLVGYAVASASPAYINFAVGTDLYFRGSSANGLPIGVSFPVKAGNTYSIYSSNNINSANSTYRFIPFA